MYKCEKCAKTFSRIDNLTRHKAKRDLICQVCNIKFTRRDNLVRHYQSKHSFEQHTLAREEGQEIEASMANKEKKPRLMTSNNLTTIIECSMCKMQFDTNKKYIAHIRSKRHIEQETEASGERIQKIKSAFKNRIVTYRITADDNISTDINMFLQNNKETCINLLQTELDKLKSCKVNLEVFAYYTKMVNSDKNSEDFNPTFDLKSFNTKFKIITSTNDKNQVLDELFNKILKKSEEFQERDSGWALYAVSHFLININQYQPIKGGSYIRLPKEIEAKKACINIINNDNACIAWCIAAALHPVEGRRHNNPEQYRQYFTEVNLTNINLPCAISDIPTVEKNNNVSINVYGLKYDKDHSKYMIEGPYYYTKRKITERHINLLLIQEKDQFHYVLIKNLSRLISSQVNAHNSLIHFCDGCLQYFNHKFKLIDHMKYGCNKIAIQMPQSKNLKVDYTGTNVPENILKFNNYGNQMKVPFVIVADFESLQIPISTCSPSDTNTSYTLKTHEHKPLSFAYYIMCDFDNKLNKFVTYTGTDCASVFIDKLTEDVHRIYNHYYKHIIPIVAPVGFEALQYLFAKECHICEKPFLNDFDKVMDHDHLTGKFRGAAHSNCNLNYKIPRFIPVYFHNLSNYDSHLFVKQLANNGKAGNLDVIPRNKEKYISFSKSIKVDTNKDGDIYIKLRFLDSYQLMPSSLDKLARNLKVFKFVSAFFPNTTEQNLVTRKGVFPYEYLNSWEKLEETRLPSIEHFFSKLNNSGITTSDYEHAINVWNTFRCNTIREYSDLYLKIDVLLLAEVIEQFRETCYKTYKLDPAHYYTAPGLSLDAMLKKTKVEIQLLTDHTMLNFLQSNIRGGLSQCSHRFAQANNKYIPTYDVSKEENYLCYWDACNLYGWAMSQPLPLSDFEWVTDCENLDVCQIPDDNDVGYILDVNIDYPRELHDYHNDLPLLPQNMQPPGSKQKKLLTTLYDKQNYVLHYRNLKQAIEHGLKLVKINRAIKFKQSTWLKEYIDLNTKLRQAAANDFERDFFKLMCNAIFGKTMENLFKRTIVKLCQNWENCNKKYGARALISNPRFNSCAIFDDNLVAVQLNPSKVFYNKPIFVGFSILDLSKVHMYNFYYNFVKKHYPNELSKLLYIDTDSLTMLLKTKDVYNTILQNPEYFDTSNFPNNNPYNITPQNKAVLGLFKDEYGGRIMHKFVGLKSKCYSQCLVSKINDDQANDVTKKAKGTKKCIVQNSVSFNDYIECLFNQKPKYVKQYLFKNESHTIYTSIQHKICLSFADDKRCIQPDGISSYAWGHCNISI